MKSLNPTSPRATSLESKNPSTEMKFRESESVARCWKNGDVPDAVPIGMDSPENVLVPEQPPKR